MARGLRVIAGSVGGRRLLGPPGREARPTSDRVKEAVFGGIGDRVVDAMVLDLYAGSGALTIEALSRGARGAVLVERERAALDVIRHNLEITGFADAARASGASVAAFLRAGPPEEAPFDLVLVDPPYDLVASELGRAIEALAAPGWLAPGAAVVVERRTKGEPVAFPAAWDSGSNRVYGDTLVTIATAD